MIQNCQNCIWKKNCQNKRHIYQLVWFFSSLSAAFYCVWVRFYGGLNLTNHVLILPLQSEDQHVLCFTVWLALPVMISRLFTSSYWVSVCIQLAKVTAVLLCNWRKNLGAFIHHSVACNFRFLIMYFLFFFPQLCQISVQPPVNGELILRFQQLQSRLATLKIENEEVKCCK